MQISPQRGCREDPMTPEERERMQFLCEQIAKEEDPEKFTKLVQELNDLLEHKVKRVERPARPLDSKSSIRLNQPPPERSQ
jgi:hypothetical protein